LVSESTKKMLGYVYFWGGRSAYKPFLIGNEKIITGVDCSGLIGLNFLIHNLNLPR
jgi:hypothetical protein